MADNRTIDDDAVRRALARQQDGEAHDRSLIRERLRWSLEQRLAANTEFLAFYFAVRPSGPRVRDE